MKILINLLLLSAMAFAQQEIPEKKDAEVKETTVINDSNKPIKRKKIDTGVISTQINSLKTEVISAKTQVLVLKDLLKKEGLDGSQRPLLISFKSDLGERYIVDTVTYKLNGDIIYQYVIDTAQESAVIDVAPKKLIETKVVPGPYTFEVQIVYRGNDTGVFSYLKGYRITRNSKINLNVKKINSTQVSVSTFESGWVFTDFKDRPQLQITQN